MMSTPPGSSLYPTRHNQPSHPIFLRDISILIGRTQVRNGREIMNQWKKINVNGRKLIKKVNYKITKI